MKIKVIRPVEVNIETIRIKVPVRYDEEDIPNDFPLRTGDIWEAAVNVDTGVIRDWPQDKSGKLHMKVCDSGRYTLYDSKGFIVEEIIEDYVPNGIVPGQYGDYIDLDISHDGTILNWPKHPDVTAFFRSKDQ